MAPDQPVLVVVRDLGRDRRWGMRVGALTLPHNGDDYCCRRGGKEKPPPISTHTHVQVRVSVIQRTEMRGVGIGRLE